MVMEWCWQAEKRGLLQGDLCTAQSIAKMIAVIMEDNKASMGVRSLNEHLCAIERLWLTLEHPKVARKIEKGEEEDMNSVDLSADSMEGVLEQLMRMSGVEPQL